MSTEDIQDEPYEHGEPQPWRFTIWHSIGLMVLLGILQAWVYFALSRAAGVELKELSWMHIALINGVSGAITVWAGATLSGYSISGALGGGKIEAAEALSALLAIVGVSILSSELNNLLQWIAPITDAVDMSGNFMNENLAGVLFTVSFIAPVLEELIFRGVILDGLRRTYRLQTSILVSAILFAIVHVHPYLMINAFFLGLLFALIRLRTGSLLLCMLIHGFYNAIPFLLTRVVSVQITGYTAFSSDAVQFQPLWFDGLGIALTALGLAGLRFASHD